MELKEEQEEQDEQAAKIGDLLEEELDGEEVGGLEKVERVEEEGEEELPEELE